MISTSKEFKEKVLKNRIFFCAADIQFRDGETLELPHERFMAEGWKFTEGTSGNGSFDIGAAIINSFTALLDNSDEALSKYDFTKAVISPRIGLQLEEGRIEWIRRGIYTVDSAATSGNIIHLQALDNLEKFDRPYSESTLQYPATLAQILRDACQVCGVTLATSQFDQQGYIVRQRPEDEALTFREVVAYVAQIGGYYARCDTTGALRLAWYKTDLFTPLDGLDGQYFDRSDQDRYISGDNADGGDFADYTTGDEADGGAFDELKNWHHIYNLKSQEICTDDVVITGICATDAEGAETLAGTEGYVLQLESNPLILDGEGEGVASALYKKIAGMRFRPLSVTCLGDPSIEAGDPAIVSDRKGNAYPCFITNLQFTIGVAMSISCDAETPSANSAASYSAATKAVVAARKETQKQISTYDLAVQRLTSLVTQSFGAFKSEEILSDGSTIFYMHDKPTREESQHVWRMAGNVFAVSSDGGKTWNAGLDSDGNAVLNVLSVVGINAEWINVDDLSAFKATIGGWRIDEEAIYRDYDAGSGVIYRTRIKSPRSAADWVFSCQKSTNSGQSFSGTFYARADGYVYSKDFHMDGGAINVNAAGTNSSIITINYNGNKVSLFAGRVFVEGSSGYQAGISITDPAGVLVQLTEGGAERATLSANAGQSRLTLVVDGEVKGSFLAKSNGAELKLMDSGSSLVAETYDGRPLVQFSQDSKSLFLSYETMKDLLEG